MIPLIALAVTIGVPMLVAAAILMHDFEIGDYGHCTAPIPPAKPLPFVSSASPRLCGKNEGRES